MPPGDGRSRSRGVPYRKREPSTAVLVDDPPSTGPLFGQPHPPESAAEETLALARTFRHLASLSFHVHRANEFASGGVQRGVRRRSVRSAVGDKGKT